jgi:hypothetical protein
MFQANLAQVNPNEGLIRRPTVVWQIRQFDSQLDDVVVHVLSKSSFGGSTSKVGWLIHDFSNEGLI